MNGKTEEWTENQMPMSHPAQAGVTKMEGISPPSQLYSIQLILTTVKILKIGTPIIITVIALQMEQLDFTVQYCVQKMQTE